MIFLFALIKTFCKILYYSSDLCKRMVVTYLVFNSVKSGCKKTPKIGYSPYSSVQSSPGCSYIPMLPSARCPVQLDHGHPDDPFRSVPRLARCNVHPCAPFSSMAHPARCAVQLGAPSARSSLQFGFPFRSVPPSAACPGQLPSSPTTTAGHLTVTRNTVPCGNLLCQQCIYQLRDII